MCFKLLYKGGFVAVRHPIPRTRPRLHMICEPSSTSSLFSRIQLRGCFPFCAPILALVAVMAGACDAKKGNPESEESSSDGMNKKGKKSSEADKNKKSGKSEDSGAKSDGDSKSKDDPNTGPNTDDSSSEGTGDSKADPSPLKEVSAADYCGVMSKIICEAEERCCKKDAWKSESLKSCIDSSQKDCAKELDTLFNDKRSGYDKKKAAAALELLKTKTKDCDPKFGDWFVSRSQGMLSIFGGSVDRGESCTPKDQEDRPAMFSCKSGMACRIKVGIPPTGSCGDFKAKGDGCVTHFECKDTLWCTAPMGGVGKCEARKALGEDCGEGIECESLSCEGKKCTEPQRDEVYCVERKKE